MQLYTLAQACPTMPCIKLVILIAIGLIMLLVEDGISKYMLLQVGCHCKNRMWDEQY